MHRSSVLLALLLVVSQSAAAADGVSIVVSQINRPTIDPDGYNVAAVVFAIDVTNQTSEAIRVKRIELSTPPDMGGHFRIAPGRFAIQRTLTPGATTRIPMLREIRAGYGAASAEGFVKVELAMTTPSGERVETIVQPIHLRVDSAVRVHRP